MPPEKSRSCIYRIAKKLRPILPYGVLANLLQWITGEIHEADFEMFKCLAQVDGLVLDVGASRGQSALSILGHTSRLRVCSIEPNRKHRWSLLLIRLLHPLRFSFRLVAAGDESSRKTLYVPGRRASGLSAQGSLDPAEFDKDYVHQRLAESGFDASDKSGYRLMSVSVVPLDRFNLAPDLIKLDVEGFEQQALNGLENTFCNHYPALLVEINNPE
jgi:FkbM family methyltransferase